MVPWSSLCSTVVFDFVEWEVLGLVSEAKRRAYREAGANGKIDYVYLGIRLVGEAEFVSWCNSLDWLE
jgi:hypothetical protein